MGFFIVLLSLEQFVCSYFSPSLSWEAELLGGRWAEHVQCQSASDLPFCFHVGSTVTFAMFFRHMCSDIRSIHHRCSRCQGLQVGSPRLLLGTSHTGGCRAPGWPTLPAPRKTSSPATPQPLSSKLSARSCSGSPRSRPPCRTSTADRPHLADLPSIRFLWKQD